MQADLSTGTKMLAENMDCASAGFQQSAGSMKNEGEI